MVKLIGKWNSLPKTSSSQLKLVPVMGAEFFQVKQHIMAPSRKTWLDFLSLLNTSRDELRKQLNDLTMIALWLP
jgi:hypothetical protein